MAEKASSAKTASSKPASSKPASSKTASSKPKPSKSAGVKTSKSAVAKPTAAPKAIKALAKAKIKAVKTPVHSKNKSAATAAHTAATGVEAYYVTLDPLPVQIHSGQPLPGALAVEFSSFAEAKERAIDQLIELIEEAERRLQVLRRANSRDEYPH